MTYVLVILTVTSAQLGSTESLFWHGSVAWFNLFHSVPILSIFSARCVFSPLISFVFVFTRRIISAQRQCSVPYLQAALLSQA